MDAGIEDDDDQEIMAETMVAMDFTKMVEYKRQNARQGSVRGQGQREGIASFRSKRIDKKFLMADDDQSMGQLMRAASLNTNETFNHKLVKKLTVLNSSAIDADGMEKDIRESSLKKMQTDLASNKDASINLKTREPLYTQENIITRENDDEDDESATGPKIEIEATSEHTESVDMSEADKNWKPQEYKKMGSVNVRVQDKQIDIRATHHQEEFEIRQTKIQERLTALKVAQSLIVDG